MPINQSKIHPVAPLSSDLFSPRSGEFGCFITLERTPRSIYACPAPTIAGEAADCLPNLPHCLFARKSRA
jgi:hypothetical protein